MIALSHLGSVSTAAVTAVPALYQLLRVSMSRLYSTLVAAQPQRNPDYYLYDEDSTSSGCRLELTPMAETEGSVPDRGVQWAFIGSPRANRHVYAEMLSELLQVPHISMASLVRQELSPRSSVYKQVLSSSNYCPCSLVILVKNCFLNLSYSD